MTEEDEAFNEIERQAKQRKESVKAAITKEKTMNNPPAFPTGNIAPDTFGMTLRDYFAAKATEEDIKHYERSEDGEMVGVDTLGTEWRRPRIIYHTREEAKYRYADAMLKAREA